MRSLRERALEKKTAKDSVLGIFQQLQFWWGKQNQNQKPLGWMVALVGRKNQERVVYRKKFIKL